MVVFVLSSSGEVINPSDSLENLGIVREVAAVTRGEDPLSGAVGATIGEVVADAMIARALEQTRADVLEQLDYFRDTYGTLPPVQRRGIINSNL